MSQDYYATLGVERTASDDQIRKAYREQARKHHPDLNPDNKAAKQKFQDIQQAFEVLGDEQKRKQYDRFGPGFERMAGGASAGPGGWPAGGAGPGFGGAGFGGAGGGGNSYHFDLNDLFGGGGAGGGFADLFKQFSGGHATQRPHGSNRGRPDRGGPSQTGPRTGRDPGDGRDPSRGEDLNHEITIPFGTAVSGGQASLAVQRGEGGPPETLSVRVPAGIEDGKKIRLRGRGQPAPTPGGAAGDLLLQVRVAPHPFFSRRGNRLEVTAPISLAEAVAGAKIDIPTPRGAVTLSVPPGTSSGKKLRVKGHGVAPDGGEPGDLLVELQIVLPEGLSQAEREEIARLAGDRPADPRADLRW